VASRREGPRAETLTEPAFPPGAFRGRPGIVPQRLPVRDRRSPACRKAASRGAVFLMTGRELSVNPVSR